MEWDPARVGRQGLGPYIAARPVNVLYARKDPSMSTSAAERCSPASSWRAGAGKRGQMGALWVFLSLASCGRGLLESLALVAMSPPQESSLRPHPPFFFFLDVSTAL